MTLGALSFLSPWPLLGLLALPVIWWLLRTTPPSPQREAFPPTKILRDLLQTEKSPAHSPWWLTLLRLVVAGLVILALSRPVLNNDSDIMTEAASGPVILLIDNGWRAAKNWQLRKQMMLRIIEEAEAKDQLLYIVPTASTQPGVEVKALRPDESLSLAERMEPSALNGNRVTALTKLQTALDKSYASVPANELGGQLYWLSDGIDNNEPTLKAAFEEITRRGVQITIVNPVKKALPLGLSARLGKGGTLYGIVEAVPFEEVRKGEVLALSQRGDRLGQVEFELKANASNTEVKIDLPLELRNQISKLQIKGSRSAGTVHLMDQRSHWRRVGLLSNERGVQAQPLLSPLYYINRALEPYAEIARSNKPDLALSIEDFTERNVSVIVMSDIGRLIGAPLLRLSEWVEAGGVLVRFAGPHMEKSQDGLLPTPLRQGGRRLGGALSWSKPQTLMDFDDNSPFAGLNIAEDVIVRRQLLADPARLSDNVYIWARLKDGTPLVTAKQEVNGWVVLVHVTANSEWSTLPLSGLFVDMLRRLTQLSIAPVGLKDKSKASAEEQSGAEKQAKTEEIASQTPEKSALLAPLLVLDGFGQADKPGPEVESVAFHKLNTVKISAAHPPGLYGPDGQSVALNIFPHAAPLSQIKSEGLATRSLSYLDSKAVKLRAPFFTIALLLLIIDSLVVLWMRGALNFYQASASRAGALLAAGLGFLLMSFGTVPFVQAQDGTAQSSEMKAALNTHLAYVVTGNTSVDGVSKAGLKGLTYILNRRTAVEPLEPLGVNISRDELAFYPLLYWPVGPYTKPISEKVAQRINAYMKDGGMIIFDTKDQDGRIGDLEGTGAGPLKRLLSKLDIPRLEPVPKGHVLTKSFYLLSRFPGRFQGGDLWVEASTRKRSNSEKEASEIDGVSTILITSNDLVSAWAIDEAFQPMFPVVPGGNLQREMAFRVGVNIVMYALAGNYKADQVHVPALLERLGQ